MKKNLYWEITTDAGGINPEDNTIILKADDMQEALKIFQDNRGYMTVKGSAKKCRQIYYFFDPLNYVES